MSYEPFENVSVEPDESDKFAALVFHSVEFVRSLTKYYGPAKAHEVWEKIAEVAGDEIKLAAFKSMLTGNSGVPRTVTIVGHDVDYQKIPAIKAIRKYSGMGLKEAKDASEIVLDMSGGKVKFAVAPNSGVSATFENISADFRAAGFNIQIN